MKFAIYAALFFIAFEFVLGGSYPYHNAILFVNEFNPGRPGSTYTAIGPGGITTNSRYFEAIEYWKSLISKCSIHSTLVDGCYNKVCQMVVLQETQDQFLNIEVRTKVFSRNVTGYTFSQLLNPGKPQLRYEPTTIKGKYKHTIKQLVLESFRLISLSWGNPLTIENILIGQYPGWTTFVTRNIYHNSYGEILPIEQISCITKSAIESPKNLDKSSFCVHVVDTHYSKFDIRLYNDNSASFVDSWGLPCSEIDIASEFELGCIR